jgi:2-methylaconitate cis-trans-isomerase PrpF
MQTAIPCTLIRGGTSKGAFFLASDLPAQESVRDRVLLAALGSPDPRQVDGIGGADPLTSKVAIVGPSSHPEADVDFLFAQVAVDRATVDTSVSCGNLVSGVGPFAIEAGLVRARDPETCVRVHAVNTGALVEVVVQTPGRRVQYHGDAAIDGVPGTAAPVLLGYGDVAGAKTGALLPTGSARDRIGEIEVTCLDAAVPLVVIPAASVGLTGAETPHQVNSDADLLAQLELLRRLAARRMGLGDVRDKVMPKLALISAPAGGRGIRSRYFMPHACHAAHAVTGAIAVACCAVLEGSVADGLACVGRSTREQVAVEHPGGSLSIELELERRGAALEIRRAALLRTARPLFRGRVLIPSSVWTLAGARRPVLAS